VHSHIAVSDVRTLRELLNKLLYTHANVVFVGLQSLKKYVRSTSLTNGDDLGNNPRVPDVERARLSVQTNNSVN